MSNLEKKAAASAYKELQQGVRLLMNLSKSLNKRNAHKPDMETIRETLKNAIENHLSETSEWLAALKIK